MDRQIDPACFPSPKNTLSVGRIDCVGSVLNVFPQDGKGIQIHGRAQKLEDVLTNHDLTTKGLPLLGRALKLHTGRGHQTTSITGPWSWLPSGSSYNPAS